jgi:hypothetical protein
MGHCDDCAGADSQVILMNWTGHCIGSADWSSFTVRFRSRSRRHAGDLAVCGNWKCLGRAFTVRDRPIAVLCGDKHSPSVHRAFEPPRSRSGSRKTRNPGCAVIMLVCHGGQGSSHPGLHERQGRRRRGPGRVLPGRPGLQADQLGRHRSSPTCALWPTKSARPRYRRPP